MKNKPELVTSQDVKLDSEYVQWIHEIKQRFRNSQIKAVKLISDMEDQIDTDSVKLKQVASEIHDVKVKQVASELEFPSVFAFVPWMHHILIIQKSRSIEEALFYIRKTVEGNLSRNALEEVLEQRMTRSVVVSKIFLALGTLTMLH